MILKNQDCLEFLRSISSDSVDYINVDPPYNIGYDGKDGWDSFRTDAEYLSWCREWASECARVLKPSRMFSIWGSQKYDVFFRLKLDVLNHLGLVSQTSLHWQSNWGGRTRKNFAHKFETAWCYSKGGEFFFNADEVRQERILKRNIRTGRDYEEGAIPTTIWDYNLVTVSHESKESRFHPTVKPQFIIQRMIKAYSNPGDLILDCFSGSGSTAIAALTLNRRFIGCELNEVYYLKSLKRIQKSQPLYQFFS